MKQVQSYLVFLGPLNYSAAQSGQNVYGKMKNMIQFIWHIYSVAEAPRVLGRSVWYHSNFFTGIFLSRQITRQFC